MGVLDLHMNKLFVCLSQVMAGTIDVTVMTSLCGFAQLLRGYFAIYIEILLNSLSLTKCIELCKIV